jgi:hypothetical protein
MMLAEKDRNGEEVKPMNYIKPELVASGSTLAAIRGLESSKPTVQFIDQNMGPDFGTRTVTQSAYQADE